MIPLLCPDYKIGATLNGMLLLPDWGIAYPENSYFEPWSSRQQGGDKVTRGDGFPFAQWLWPRGMTRDEYNILMSFISEDVASGHVYIRTRNNRARGLAFANYYAVMNRPVLTGDGGQPSENFVDAFTQVKVLFVGMELQA